jgi:NAD(P)-dependent dehydrogenase (short-subunit alcohol dehydrogenase family)
MTDGRTFLVTGATGAIGQAIARQLAQHPEHRVVLLARHEAKASAAVDSIRRATGNGAVSYELADVSRRADIEALAQRWEGPLHVLINNAAITPRQREETPEGIELQWATNVLAYLWLTEAFTPILHQSAPARVVNVASYWAGDLDLADVEFKRRPYRNGTAYRQSKQANRMLTMAQAERLAPLGISVNVCHPGDVNSALSNNLGFGGSQSPDEGARTPVWLATDPIGQKLTGHYFEQRRPTPCRFAADRAAIEQLYQLCQAY